MLMDDICVLGRDNTIAYSMQMRCKYSSKESSVLFHTPSSSFDFYGKAVGAELLRPLLPLLAHQAYVSTRGSTSLTGALLPVRPTYHGTDKHSSIEKGAPDKQCTC